MRCFGLGARGQHADRHVGDALEIAGEIEPALARHHDIEDDDVERQAAHGSARGRGVRGGRHAKAVLEQIARQQVADALVVVDHENVRRVVGQLFHAASRGAIGSATQSRRLAAAARRRQQRLHLRALLLADHAEKKRAHVASLPGPHASRAPRDALGLHVDRAGSRGWHPLSVARSSRSRRSSSPPAARSSPRRRAASARGPGSAW